MGQINLGDLLARSPFHKDIPNEYESTLFTCLLMENQERTKV